MPYLGEIILFAGDYAIEDWLPCDGRELSVSQNQALYSIIGNRFGGDGIKTFCLPDLRKLVAVGADPKAREFVASARGGNSSQTVSFDLPLLQHTHEATFVPQTAAPVPANPITVKIATNTAGAPTYGGTTAIPNKSHVLASGKAGAGVANIYAASDSLATDPDAYLGGVTVSGGDGGQPGGVTGGTVTVKAAGTQTSGKVSASVNVYQPYLALTYLICVASGDYPPKRED